MADIGMDVINVGEGAVTSSGTIAQTLLNSQFNAGALRPWVENGRAWTVNAQGITVPAANATLRKDEWKDYDTAIVEAAMERLPVANTFISRGLTYSIPNGLGKMVLEYEDMNEFTDASVNMDPQVPAIEDRPVSSIKYLPLPVIYKEFRVNIRALEASRTTGAPLDTTAGEMAGRKVAEMIEEITCNGSSTFTFGGGSLYGLKDYTNNNTGSLTADWDDSAATGETMLADVLTMKQALIAAEHYGPYGIFVPTNYDTALDGDFKSYSDKTIRQRILEVSGIEFVTVADHLTADYVVMVQLTGDVMRMVMGLPVTTVQWESRGGLSQHFMVMAIIVPQPRAKQDLKCGIAVYN